MSTRKERNDRVLLVWRWTMLVVFLCAATLVVMTIMEMKN